MHTDATDKPGRRPLPAGMAAAAVVLASMAGCQSSPSCPALTRPLAAAPAAAGVPNFAKVCDGLFRGGQPTDAGFAALRRAGVRTIVSLRTTDGQARRLRREGFRTFHISFKTLHPETEDVLKFLSIATDPACRPVFVHCRRGADRTGMMVALYRMVVQDWPRGEAMREMRQMGFSDWNVAIEEYLEHVDVPALKGDLARYSG